MFFFFYIFFDFLKTLLLDLTLKKRPKNPGENTHVYVKYFFLACIV